LICRVLARFADCSGSQKIVKDFTEKAKQGKMWQVEAAKRSKNVVGIGGFYYSQNLNCFI